jgi:RHH-type proline utilization regulon transcriptional repressor/proline dehydrogenase/delta 1-pyrroline-5-carboxylate dehydrogenase
VIASAFDSAGQRCSALRVLCLQEEIAKRTLAMLKGAVLELAIGRPDRLAADIGPVISAEAKANIENHISAMRAKGRPVFQAPLPAETAHGTFVPPTIIEIESVSELKREVFGPVLHVVRYRREDLDRLIDGINATGYGLTFGLHTRLDEMIEHVRSRIEAGNVYINRNMIGAVVGVQPFGGRGLSGTGPKAGGTLYLHRLIANPSAETAGLKAVTPPAPFTEFLAWLQAKGFHAEAQRCADYAKRTLVGTEIELPGPTGERNLYALRPRGRVLLIPETETGLFLQMGAALVTGNEMLIDATKRAKAALRDLPGTVAARIKISSDWCAAGPLAAALIEGGKDRLCELNRRFSEPEGPLLLTQGASAAALASGAQNYCLDWLLEETSTSINTAAAGGNATLMAVS